MHQELDFPVESGSMDRRKQINPAEDLISGVGFEEKRL
jgi:hypothetical protein